MSCKNQNEIIFIVIEGISEQKYVNINLKNLFSNLSPLASNQKLQLHRLQQPLKVKGSLNYCH